MCFLIEKNVVKNSLKRLATYLFIEVVRLIADMLENMQPFYAILIFSFQLKWRFFPRFTVVTTYKSRVISRKIDQEAVALVPQLFIRLQLNVFRLIGSVSIAINQVNHFHRTSSASYFP